MSDSETALNPPPVLGRIHHARYPAVFYDIRTRMIDDATCVSLFNVYDILGLACDDATVSEGVLVDDEGSPWATLDTLDSWLATLDPVRRASGQRLLTWLTSRLGQSRAPRDPRPTRWGWQPVKTVIKTRGATLKSFTLAVNAIQPEAVEFADQVTLSHVAAAAYGESLPKNALLARAEAHLGVPRTELFTPAVLEEVDRRAQRRATRDGKLHDA